jgi:hypothetical protein
MITPAQLAEAYERNATIVKQQAAGMTHAESVAPLPFNANCMNWVLGHMVLYRNRVLQALGEEPAVDPARLERYARDGEPLRGDEAGVVPLDELLAGLERSQALVSAGLARISEEQLAREVALTGRTARPISFWLFFLYFHDTFHTGETSVLRQAHGKADKVI